MASGEAVACCLALLRQSTVEAPPRCPTDPPQAEGNMTSGEAVACCLALLRQSTVEAPPQSLTRLTLRKRRET